MSSEVFDRVQGILTSWVVIVLVISYHGEDLLGDGSTTTITSLMMALALGLLGVITYHYLYHYLGHHYLDHYRYDVLHLLQLLSGHIYLMLFIYLLVFHLDLPMLAMTYLPGRHSVVFTVFTVVVRTAILFQIGLMIRSWVERRYPTPPPATTTNLYIGRILDLFDTKENDFDENLNPPIFLIVEFPNFHENQLIPFFLNLPLQTLLIVIQHGQYSLGIQVLEELRRNFQSEFFQVDQNLELSLPRAIFHLNHERPWCNNSLDNLDYVYNDINHLITAYQQYDLVFRNYYYYPLLSTSHYVPVGFPHTQYLLGDYSMNKTIQPWIKQKLSNRSKLCYFKGRIDYNVGTRQVTLDDDEEHMIDRQRLYQLATSSSGSGSGYIGPCQVNSYDPMNVTNQSGKRKYEDYIWEMKDVAFALCPIGNNPETFRIYEALEVGAVPILVRSQHVERDFLNHPLWQDYPGPILTSWEELPTFFANLTLSDADDLQVTLQVWYKTFQQQQRTIVKTAWRQWLSQVYQQQQQHESSSSSSTTMMSLEDEVEEYYQDYPITLLNQQYFYYVSQEKVLQITLKDLINIDFNYWEKKKNKTSLPSNSSTSSSISHDEVIIDDQQKQQQQHDVVVVGGVTSQEEEAEEESVTSGSSSRVLEKRVNELEMIVKDLLIETIRQRQRIDDLEQQLLLQH
eukprot:gene6933-7671_t